MRLVTVLLMAEVTMQNRAPVRQQWEVDPVHFVPPLEWETYDIPQSRRQYMEHEWSLASYANDCGEEGSVNIVPVYFWPGDQVDLPCLMCELGFVFNGKMKIWGKSTDILKFLENPKRNTRPRNISAMDVIDRMPETLGAGGLKENALKQDTIYIQRRGKLSIIRASPASQGVYFCYDSQSRLHTSIFYVVMAMIPPVRMSEMKDVFADGCKSTADTQLIRANFNWRYHFVPNFRRRTPNRCKKSTHRFCDASYYTWVDEEDDCTLEFCRKELEAGKIALNLALEIRWDDWSECEQNRQLRERQAHCYLVRKSGYEIPRAEDQLPHEYKWMPKLNSLFDQEPFRSRGIRLYSSLLASLFVDEEVMKKCYYDEKRTDRIWRMLIRTMGVSYKDSRGKEGFVEVDGFGNIVKGPQSSIRLTNAFHACMIYEYDNERNVEHVVGTYMTETRPCSSTPAK
ncbi:hypothetical protein Q1695_009438 [Nippostrongylus brasiliensis]|nr:hypothetical protein Q1695_009438 [Nippostrongylus brasiliensis]